MGTPKKWDKKYAFRIEIDGVERAAFTTCSPIKGSVNNSEYFEGGRAHPHNSPSTVRFPEITMSRGACDDEDLYNWFVETYNALTETGEVEEDLFKDLDIVQLDRAGNELRRYRCYDCYCGDYDSGDWDNASDDVRMETLIIRYDHPQLIKAS